ASRIVMSMPSGFHGRVEAARVLFARLIDVGNFCEIFDLLDREDQSELVKSLGWLNIFNPEKPDRFYELDLSVLEDYNMAKILIRLAVIEEGDNWLDGYTYSPTRDEAPYPHWILPASWDADDTGKGEGPRRTGILRLVFTSKLEDGCIPDWDARREIKNRVLSLVMHIAGAALFSSVVALSNAQPPPTTGWLNPLVVKGSKFFDSASGDEFRVKGIAFYPRANTGKNFDANSVDWFTDDMEPIWRPHLEHLKALGINTIRLYAVDPTAPHDKFMCELSKLGIYAFVGMAAICEGCYVLDTEAPKCYTDAMFTRAMKIYNAFAVYDNVIVRCLSLKGL
ncbi:hypothetical protein DYB25_011322, partial [Aphanomyces astaci]